MWSGKAVRISVTFMLAAARLFEKYGVEEGKSVVPSTATCHRNIRMIFLIAPYRELQKYAHGIHPSRRMRTRQAIAAEEEAKTKANFMQSLLPYKFMILHLFIPWVLKCSHEEIPSCDGTLASSLSAPSFCPEPRLTE